jgi:hypothetical protein
LNAGADDELVVADADARGGGHDAPVGADTGGGVLDPRNTVATPAPTSVRSDW